MKTFTIDQVVGIVFIVAGIVMLVLLVLSHLKESAMLELMQEKNKLIRGLHDLVQKQEKSLIAEKAYSAALKEENDLLRGQLEDESRWQ